MSMVTTIKLRKAAEEIRKSIRRSARVLDELETALAYALEWKDTADYQVARLSSKEYIPPPRRLPLRDLVPPGFRQRQYAAWPQIELLCTKIMVARSHLESLIEPMERVTRVFTDANSPTLNGEAAKLLDE